MRVYISANHGEISIKVHDTSFIWVESVTTSGFKACLVLGGQGNGGNTTKVKVTLPSIGLLSKVPNQVFMMDRLNLTFLPLERSAKK